MIAYLKKVPLPICGVALGLAALGNLLQSYSESLRSVLGLLSLLCLLLYLGKALAVPGSFQEDMKNPVTASVFGTCTMALMLLAGYLKPLAPALAFLLWWAAVLGHLVLIIFFSLRFLRKLDMKKVFASYYIVYVGIAVAGVSAPAFGMEKVGEASFWFGFAAYLLLLLLVSRRYLSYPELPEPARALICIYAAPGSLCVAAYVQSVGAKSLPFLYLLYALSAVFYIFGLVCMVKYIRTKFYPSFAAFTFPFVISAIASKMTMACAGKLGSPLPWLSSVVLVETILAAVLVLYVLCRFCMFIFTGKKS